MNSTFEQKSTRPSMAEMKAMQQTALSRSIDKAGNLQKAVTLTEENWTGLTGAVALTCESMLRLEERVGHLLTGEQMDAMLKEQVKSLMAEHSTAVTQMQTAVRDLNESSVVHWNRIVEFTEDSLRETKQAQETALKEFGKQVRKASERYSSELSEVTDTLKRSARRVQWQMYLPTVILVLWELVRHLFLLG